MIKAKTEKIKREKIREKILVSFNNIDYVFNYYDDFYYKFFMYVNC